MTSRAIYFLYRFLLLAALPLIIVYLLGRSLRNREYLVSLRERFGLIPALYRETGAGGIWLHAVSVGEVLSAVGLVCRLRDTFPGTPIVVSTSTLAGRALANQKLAGLADRVLYAPLDFVFVLRRWLRRVRPAVVVVLETEIWPNLFREAKRAGCGLLIVNGRISDRAAPRYFRLRWLFQHVLDHADSILTQNAAMRDAYLRAGAPPDRVRAGGNLKYDFEPGAAPAWVDSLLANSGASKVWIAASTMPPDEDGAVIAAFRQLAARNPRLLLLLAPRKPELFDQTAERLAREGIPHLRRSRLDGAGRLALPGVLLLDSIGELSGLFARADVVFMGGSIVPRGGHNILEPAAWAKPVVVGPHMENFREIAEQFRAAGALVEIASAGELAAAVGALLEDAGRASEIGARARQCAESRRGATAAAVAEIRRLYDEAVPGVPAPLRIDRVFWALSALCRLLLRPGRLPRPVVSVGNLTMGGTGKTPVVLYLAGQLPKPAILTRGYRRESSRDLLLAPGERAEARATGDEAQIFLRAGVAAVGIGANRRRIATELLARFDVETVLLDDGFQHWRLARDLDIVLLDAQDPFPPLRLREPPGALARAGIVLITRAAGPRPGLERVVRRYNASAPTFYAQVRPLGWVEGATGRELPAGPLPFAHVAAFCGLGNPGSFWQTLARLGVHPLRKVAFPDHARYDAADIARLREGVEALVTTEKDWVNLKTAEAGVYWLKIGVAIDREEEFLSAVRKRLATLRV